MNLLKILNYILIGTLLALRPLLGPARCKFPISCTNYAVMVLKEKNICRAVWLIAKRILSCNPFKNVSP